MKFHIFPRAIQTTVDDNLRVLKVQTDMFCGNLFEIVFKLDFLYIKDRGTRRKFDGMRL